MNVSLEESYALCRQIARRAGTNFYWSFLVLPPEKRRAMYAIYAFMRKSDDIADSAGNPQSALQTLRQWRRSVDAALAGRDSPEPILRALADTVQRYRIAHRYFHDVLDGAEMDQTTTRYATFAELYKYCYRVASAVGLIVLPIFGYETDAALEPAEACGIAFQLTNILRDVGEDARMGRIYLPLEDLKSFGVSEDDIMNARSSPQFIELMKFQADRARQFYRRARPLLEMIEPDSRRTLAVMMGIYGGLLEKLERKHFAVFGERIRLGAAEKLAVVARQWRGAVR
jgi:phytoene synthase